ncbi:MAG: hypothetical protein ACLU8S_04750 [Coprococcus phoceensis]
MATRVTLQTATEWLPQDRLGKDRIGKASREKRTTPLYRPLPLILKKSSLNGKGRNKHKKTMGPIYSEHLQEVIQNEKKASY